MHPPPVEAGAFVEAAPISGKPQMAKPGAISSSDIHPGNKSAYCFLISSSNLSASHCFIIDW